MARFSRARSFSGRKAYVLFLCTGNTCRSPMAYGILRSLLDTEGVKDIEIRTAGVMTIPGLIPTQETRQILLKEEVDVSNHRSCKMTPDLLRRATLIFGMTSFHVQMALRMTDQARGKTFLLKEYVGIDGRNSQIQDPMGCTLEVYKKVFREIRRSCRRLVNMDMKTPGPPYAELKVKPTAVKRARPKAKPEEETATEPAPVEAPPSEKKSKAPAKAVAKKAPAAKAPPAKAKPSGKKKTESKKKPGKAKPAPAKPKPVAAKAKPSKKPIKKTVKKTAKKTAAKKTSAAKPAAKKKTAARKPTKKLVAPKRKKK